MPTQEPKDPNGSGVLPEWFPTTYEGFRNLVLGVLVAWVVSAIVGVWVSIVDSVMTVWDSFLSVGGTIGARIESIGSTIASVPVGGLGLLEELVVGLASGAGPLAPLVVVVVWAVGVVAIVVVLVAIVGGVRRAVGVLPFT